MSEIPEPTLRRNTLINLVGGLLPAAVSLATIPLYLDVVGQARYGVLAIVWLLLGYFGVFDVGLGRATANRLAQLRSAPSDEQATVFWTALTVNALFGLLGAAAFAGAGYFFLDRVLKAPVALRDEAIAGLPFVAAAVPFVTASSVCTGALEAHERFLAANVVGTLMLAVYQLLPLAFAHAFSPSLTWLFAGIAFAPVVGALAGFAACAWLVSVGTRPRFDRAAVGRLLGYGGWITVTAIVSPILTVVDRLIIGAVSGARAVTEYTVPVSVVTRISVLPLSLSRTLFPRLSGLDDGTARRLARRATLVLAAVLTPAIVVSMLLLEPFLEVWIGAELAHSGAPVGRIVLLGVWVNSLAFVPLSFLQARGRPDLPAKFHACELPLYLGVLWYAVSVGGIKGAAWAWTARVAVDAGLLFAAARTVRGMRHRR